MTPITFGAERYFSSIRARAAARFSGNHLYDLTEDPAEENNLAGSGLEKDMAAMLREALRSVDAPEEQFARLGLA